jgi:hypothetical protein
MESNQLNGNHSHKIDKSLFCVLISVGVFVYRLVEEQRKKSCRVVMVETKLVDATKVVEVAGEEVEVAVEVS